MVTKKPILLRPAIAMIELIFAIVIMGIVLMSAPQLISTAAESGYLTIQQEAINEASTHLNNVWSYPWDEELPYDPSIQEYILNVSSGHIDLNKSGLRVRRGTPDSSPRNYFDASGMEHNATATIGADTGETKGAEDDMDDYDGFTYNMTLLEYNPTMDYVEKENNITIATAVFYVNDSPNSGDYQQSSITYDLNTTPAPPTTNIKEVSVTLTSSSGVDKLNKTIILRAFKCNIDGVDEDQLADKGF